MIPPSIPPQYQPCFEVRGTEGWDFVLSVLLPKRLFARHVAKKLRVALGGIRSFTLPDGSVWGVDVGAGGARRVKRLV